MRAAGIPTSVMWFDAPWQTAYNTFIFNAYQFPDPDRLLADMADEGFKVLVWATEFLDVTDDSSEQVGMETNTRGDYEHAARNDYLIETKIGGIRIPAILPWWKGWGGNVDFSNPAATAWFQNSIRRATSKGISGFKLDAGEVVDPIAAMDVPILTGLRIPLYDSTGRKITEFGPYRMGYHKAYADLVAGDMGGDGMIISRAGCFGDQVNGPFIWPGDLTNDFEFNDMPRTIGGLPAAILAGLNVGLVGFPYYAPDIGGFKGGTPTKSSLLRWAQFGALCPVMQLGGGGNHRPWESGTWDSETLTIYRKYARLHQNLVPYIYTHALEAHRNGLPIMRPLFLHYPGDPAAAAEEFEYLFGRDLLVAPIYQDVTSREVYLPAGRWIDFWSGASYQGPLRMTVNAPLDTLPLYVRAGAILPLLDPEVDTLAPATNPSVVTYDQRKHRLRLWIYPEGASRFTLFDGTGFSSTEAATEWTLRVTTAAAPRDLELRVDWQQRAANPPTQVVTTQGALTARATRVDLDAASEGFFYDASAMVLWLKLTAGDELIAVR
jgi:alpha-D-xyloside xylohydrolase